jgi:hypothetical protein
MSCDTQLPFIWNLIEKRDTKVCKRMATFRGMPNLSFHPNTNNGDQPCFWWKKKKKTL